MTQEAPKSAFHGECEAIRAFAERLERAAVSEATVLIVGEPGAGKTRAARWLHELSPRSTGPLVVVQPAALTPTLLEAELFGHEAGAFTGADRARAGRFRGASGGTLVLDGVEDLPASLQVKLLRVLQERVVEPVGSAEAHPVDARIVATSRVPLEAEVEAGRFREDLLYRLAVVPLVVPPLRARRADLELLVEEVGRGLRASLAAPRPFSATAWELLEAHRWPGNLAELENLVLRLGVLGTPGTEVAPDELVELSEAPAGPDPAQRLAEEALDLGLRVADLEAAMVRGALARTRGNASAAARALGLTRKALEYRRDRLEADDREPEA